MVAREHREVVKLALVHVARRTIDDDPGHAPEPCT
jgi:hypothetical protein